MFYSHVIYLGTKIHVGLHICYHKFYSHVIYLGTKIPDSVYPCKYQFYSHVIYLGTKIFILFYFFSIGFTVT